MNKLSLSLYGLCWLCGALVSATAGAAGTVDETRAVGEFTGVHVGSGIQAKVETGASGPIVLRGDPAVLKKVRTEIKDSVLTITLEPDTRWSPDTPIFVSVRMPRATSLGVSGGSRMEATVPAADDFALHASGGGKLSLTNAVKPKRFALHASGGSTVTLPGVETGEAVVELSGQSRVSIAGRADTARASLSGASQLEGANLQVNSLDIEGSGAMSAAVRAARSVRGSLSGGSRVRVPASADVRVAVSGGASVQQDL